VPTSRFRVFLSAVSSEFEIARSAIASDLRSRGIEVQVQDDFRQEAGAATTLQKLHDYIRNCGAVVALVGRRSGSVPPPAAAAPFTNILPNGITQASYTQWEVLFALHYRKRLSRYLAGDDYRPDKAEPTGDDHPDLQAAFVAHLFEHLGLDRVQFSHYHAARAEELKEDWPSSRGPVVLPMPSLGPLFKGRGGFLEAMRRSLEAADSTATAIVTAAIHGLGGVGKTRAAIEYAWQYVEDYSAVLFVSAETPALLRQNLAELTGPEALNLAEQEVADESVRRAATLQWLAEHDGWLLILDNIDTPAAQAAVRDVLARVRGGHVLLTSRLSDWSGAVQPLAMDVLDPADAAQFLTASTDDRRHHQPTDAADATALSNELGGLAVALEQAAAYVSRKRISLGAYLGLWRRQANEVQGWYDPALMAYPRSVAVTWQATLDQLGAGELALLRLLAWLAPEPLPLSALEDEMVAAVWNEAAGRLSGLEPPSVTLIDALGTLADYSMVSWNTKTQTVSMHRVVQEVLRTRLDESARREWLQLSLRLLEAALPPGSPDDVRTWGVWDPLRPHVRAAVQQGDALGVAEPTTSLMGELGVLLWAKALHTEAETLERRALAIDAASYGADHPAVAVRLNNLAQTLHALNRLAEAESLMRRALTIDEASYGADHPSVARDLNNLASLLQGTNRLDEAEPLMRRALTIDEASHDANHPDVARDLNNLARLLVAR
jgi:tetratricopeptide (TPR) repeat protein